MLELRYRSSLSFDSCLESILALNNLLQLFQHHLHDIICLMDHLVLYDRSWVVCCVFDMALARVACSTTWALWYHSETHPRLLPTMGGLLLRDPSDLSFQSLFGTHHTFPGFATSHCSLLSKNTKLFCVRAGSLMDYFRLSSVRHMPWLYCTQ